MGRETAKELKGSMKATTTMKETICNFSVVKWLIKNYNELDYEVLYFQMYESRNFRCVFKLIKTVENLNVAFRFDRTNLDAHFYLPSEDYGSNLVPAEEISKGLYVAQFPHRFVFRKSGHYNMMGMLTILFRYETELRTEIRSNPYGQTGVVSTTDELLQALKLNFLLSDGPDFKINAAGNWFLVHKPILAARSKFFLEFFNKNKKAEDFSLPDTAPGIMHEVLLYMYTGEHSNMPTKSMVKMFETAYLLKMQSLKDRCFRYFEKTKNWRFLREVTFWEYEAQ